MNNKQKIFLLIGVLALTTFVFQGLADTWFFNYNYGITGFRIGVKSLNLVSFSSFMITLGSGLCYFLFRDPKK